MGATTWMPALVGVQALHGLTFALMHMAAMPIIAKSAPERLAATAQTVYGALALGIASATLTFASGYLYGWFGMRAFWPMAVLCALVFPIVSGIHRLCVPARDSADPSLGDRRSIMQGCSDANFPSRRALPRMTLSKPPRLLAPVDICDVDATRTESFDFHAKD